jgi:hypothetical protein
MLNVIMPSVIRLNVVLIGVIMLSIVASTIHHSGGLTTEGEGALDGSILCSLCPHTILKEFVNDKRSNLFFLRINGDEQMFSNDGFS